MTTHVTQYIDRPDGRLSYDDNGIDGPLVIAAPGMGDLRHVYRHIRTFAAEAGIRLATMDLRGMGDTSTQWRQLDDAAVASDYLALVDHLDAGAAVLVGNSLSCASAVLAATDAPEKVAGIMLLGPFVRDVPMKWWQQAAFKAMLMPPWGRAAWVGYYRKNMYPDASHQISTSTSTACRRTSESRGDSPTSGGSRRRAMPNPVDASTASPPTVVVMGTADPDFSDPKEEAEHIADVLKAELVWSEGSGHYPQAETPPLVADALIDLVHRVNLPSD